MMTKGKNKNNYEFPGISDDAEKLGVDRSHLWRVLKGKRESKPLMQRYRELKKSQGQEAAV